MRPRAELQDLVPYRSSDIQGGRILLHANENPYPPPPHVVEEIAEGLRRVPLNRYPDPDPAGLREALAAYARCDPERVWVGNGSNEILLECCLAFGGPGRRALVFEPTYRMHYRQARMAGGEVVDCPRTPDFAIDVQRALATIERTDPDVVFVCTPNNPTGTLASLDDLRTMAQATRGIVVVDEAYYEFSGVTFVPMLDSYPNVVVVRTMSKAFRLANVRMGYAVTSPEVIDQLRRVRLPYTQSSFTHIAALVALRHAPELLEVVPAILAQRDRLLERLRELPGIRAVESRANFVLFMHPDAARLVRGLGDRGIVVRDFSHLVPGALRVTAGTPSECEEFLEALAELL